MSSRQHNISNRGRRGEARKSNPPATRQVWVPKLKPSPSASTSSSGSAADNDQPKNAHHTKSYNDLKIQSPNSDTIVEVLSWLPAEFLLKFEIVSKGLHNIISDKSFQKLQFRRTPVTISGFFFQDTFSRSKQVKYVSFNNTRPIVHCKVWDLLPTEVTLAASSNGLLCCPSPQNLHPSMRNRVKFIYVCNPATKEYVRIEWPKGSDSSLHIALAFDPFHKSTDDMSDFKLVCISKEDLSRFMFQVYSSKQKEWKTLGVCKFGGDWCGMPDGQVVFASGVLYWIIQGNAILAFDVDLEKSYFISFPAPWMHRSKGLCENCIGESEGRLHYILVSEVGLQVWFLDSETKWSQKHTVSLSSLEKEYSHFVYSEAIRASILVPSNFVMPTWIEPIFYKDGILLLKLRCSFSFDNEKVETSYKIYLYNLGTKMEELCTSTVHFMNAIPYSMTLASLESAKQH